MKADSAVLLFGAVCFSVIKMEFGAFYSFDLGLFFGLKGLIIGGDSVTEKNNVAPILFCLSRNSKAQCERKPTRRVVLFNTGIFWQQ